jgi:hypothetical protein
VNGLQRNERTGWAEIRSEVAFGQPLEEPSNRVISRGMAFLPELGRDVDMWIAPGAFKLGCHRRQQRSLAGGAAGSWRVVAPALFLAS